MSKWISVDKQLPEKDGAYLCVVEYFSGPHIEIIDFATKLSDIDSYYFNGKHRKGWFEFDVDECTYWEVLTVTHWMPLPEPPGEITVFDRLTESPEALARLILQMHSRDISLEWCKGDKAEACVKAMGNGDFVCTDERLTECIISWLQSPAEMEVQDDD